MWVSLRSLFKERMNKKNITFFFKKAARLTQRAVWDPLRIPVFSAVMLSLVPLTAVSDNDVSAREALLWINDGRLDDAIARLEYLASQNDPEALQELSDLHGDGHFLPYDEAKSQYFLDRAVVTGYEIAIYNRAYNSSSRSKMEAMLEQGFALAACGVREYRPELDLKCQEAAEQEALRGNRHAIYALHTNQNPLAESLLKKFPYPRVLSEIYLNQWLYDPNQEALEGLVRISKLGSAKATTDILSSDFGENSEANNRTREALIDALPDSVKSHLRESFTSLANGTRSKWFGSDWLTNNNLADIYSKGNRVLDIKSDYMKAFLLLENCAENKQDKAASSCLYQQYQLLSDGGPNLMRDPEEAIKLLKKAHIKGDSTAAAVLARLHRFGTGGVP